LPAFVVIFVACEREANDILARNATATVLFKNVMSDPIESLLRMFIMTVGEFTVLYQNLSYCDSAAMEVLGKVGEINMQIFPMYQLASARNI
jgi:hypothetical protein